MTEIQETNNKGYQCQCCNQASTVSFIQGTAKDCKTERSSVDVNNLKSVGHYLKKACIDSIYMIFLIKNENY